MSEGDNEPLNGTLVPLLGHYDSDINMIHQLSTSAINPLKMFVFTLIRKNRTIQFLSHELIPV